MKKIFDKNGKEIKEKDVVMFDNSLQVVYKYKGKLCFKIFTPMGAGYVEPLSWKDTELLIK